MAVADTECTMLDGLIGITVLPAVEKVSCLIPAPRLLLDCVWDTRSVSIEWPFTAEESVDMVSSVSRAC